MIYFIINNIFEVALLSTIVFLTIGWMIDKVKVKKELKKMETRLETVENSLTRLRSTNHTILNTINNINMKLAINENNNKTD